MQGAHLKRRIVGIPRDQRKSYVLSKLHEILAGYRILAVVFAISQVQYGGCVVGQKLKITKTNFFSLFILGLSTFIQEESQGTLKESSELLLSLIVMVLGTRNDVPEST